MNKKVTRDMVIGDGNSYMTDEEVANQRITDIDTQDTNIYRFKEGDMVTPYYAPAFDFYGIIVSINPKEDRVYVDFNGTIRQMDPNELRVVLKQKLFEDFFERRGRQISASLKESIYHCDTGRKYRITAEEEESGSMKCPKCKSELQKENYKKKSPLYRCSDCDFKISSEDLMDSKKILESKMVFSESDVSQRLAAQIFEADEIRDWSADLDIDCKTASNVYRLARTQMIPPGERLQQINSLLGEPGILVVSTDDAWDENWGNAVVAYVQRESSDPTVMYDVNEGEFICSSLEDWIAENHDLYDMHTAKVAAMSDDSKYKYVPAWLKKMLVPEDVKALAAYKSVKYFDEIYKKEHNPTQDTVMQVNRLFGKLKKIMHEKEKYLSGFSLDRDSGLYRTPDGKSLDQEQYNEYKRQVRFLRRITSDKPKSYDDYYLNPDRYLTEKQDSSNETLADLVQKKMRME